MSSLRKRMGEEERPPQALVLLRDKGTQIRDKIGRLRKDIGLRKAGWKALEGGSPGGGRRPTGPSASTKKMDAPDVQ